MLTLQDINIRDPFVLAANGKYYLYGSRGTERNALPLGLDVYVSDDLETWSDPIVVFTAPEGFSPYNDFRVRAAWSDRDFWAPEVHAYDGAYYMFVTFKHENACRGTLILKADAPEGPFRLHSDGPVTPADWECLDGTLYIDGSGKPWMVFCHEWLQVKDCREQYGVRAEAFRCDVSDFSQTKETVDNIRSAFGGAHILINNAGVTRDGLIAAMKEEDFDRVLDVNLKGAFNMIRHCSRLFIANRGGVIVNISSVSGLIGNPGQANYSASKAGLIGLTKSVAKELAGRNIRCNAIAPGFIQTDMTENLNKESNQLMQAIPLGRIGRAEEVADAAAYLVCAEYVTGEVLRVDGGVGI